MEPKGIVAASQPQWISVKEGLPEFEGYVYAYASYKWGKEIFMAHYRRGYWYDCIRGKFSYSVTHWMPLPEPPKE